MVGVPRDALVRVVWQLKRIAKGGDPNNPHPGETRKMPDRLLELAEEIRQEIRQWLD